MQWRVRVVAESRSPTWTYRSQSYAKVKDMLEVPATSSALIDVQNH
jgi:hypothetical protein